MNKDLDEEFRPNRTVCDYWTFNNDKPFTEDELGEIRVDLRNWSATNKIPCEFNSTTNGFQVTIHHFCADGQSIGTALFGDLASSTFRKLDRSIFTTFVKRSIQKNEKTSNRRQLENVQAAG